MSYARDCVCSVACAPMCALYVCACMYHACMCVHVRMYMCRRACLRVHYVRVCVYMCSVACVPMCAMCACMRMYRACVSMHACIHPDMHA